MQNDSSAPSDRLKASFDRTREATIKDIAARVQAGAAMRNTLPGGHPAPATSGADKGEAP